MPEMLRPDIKFMRHQREGIARMWNMKSFILADDMGLGKAGSVSEPVLTPSGWSTMGQIQVGDQVISVDGTPTTVLGTFPQGRREIVKVTFSDGSWTKCDWDHLWEVNTPVRKKRGNAPLVKTAREIVDAGLHDGAGNRRWFIPMVAPVEFDGPVPGDLDPYTLGVLIGDGCLTQSSVTLGTDLEIIHNLALPQGASVTSVRRPGPDYYASCRIRGLLGVLRRVGLNGSRSETKSIPEEYLYSTSAVRIAVLQGLLDTDGGTVESRGQRSTSVEYGTVSKALAEQVKFIAQSLGGTASIKEKVPTYTYKGERLEGQTFYRMVLHLPSAITPFRLRRKLDKWVPRTKYEPTRSIESVEVVGREEAVCIRVDHPRHLYVTRDCIVTHNTLQTLAVCAIHAHLTKETRGFTSRVLVVAPPSLKRNWANEIEKFTGFRHFLVEGEPKKRDKIIREYAETIGHRVLIMNYEQIPKHLSLINQLDLDIVIADEAHYLKNPRARRTNAFRQVEAPRRFMLTGTPVLNHVDDLWVLLDQVQPGQWGTYWGFCQHHCIYGGFQNKAIIGVKNEKQLTENLNRVMVRRLKTDVLDLPEVQTIKREVDLLPSQLSLYRRAVKDMILERDAALGEDGEEEIANPAIRFMRLAQICSTTATVREDGRDESSKLDAAMVDLDTIVSAGEKVVVFTKFRATLACYVNRILAAYKGDVPVYVLSGDVKSDERQAVVDAWSGTSGACVIVCMIQVAGVGLNMTSGRYVQFLDKDVTPANNEQAIARVHRIGQGQHAVQVYEYQARASAEARLEALLANKKATANEVVEDKNLQDILNQILDEEME